MTLNTTARHLANMVNTKQEALCMQALAAYPDRKLEEFTLVDDRRLAPGELQRFYVALDGERVTAVWAVRLDEHTISMELVEL